MVKSPEAIENDYLKKELERVTKEYLKFASTWQTENDRLKLEAKEKTTALEDLHQKMQAMSLELAKYDREKKREVQDEEYVEAEYEEEEGEVDVVN
ncbi:Protein CBG26184 [Caenorhabditis briggsae]|uniref:Protein CBG26184 n=1 Tax=Caenorhabditis briggsae TaxID=6238 RepID=B6ILS9_CAEBR|nr:Protein CBG26184 [Caenorhabditis briggsae]CAS00859.1 Protein CBG26184 [Caenorhabditis briggsae]